MQNEQKTCEIRKRLRISSAFSICQGANFSGVLYPQF
jgi:hypothetical protein